MGNDAYEDKLEKLLNTLYSKSLALECAKKISEIHSSDLVCHVLTDVTQFVVAIVCSFGTCKWKTLIFACFIVALRRLVMLNCWDSKVVFFSMRPTGVGVNVGYVMEHEQKST